MHAGRAWTTLELILDKFVGLSVLARVLTWSPFAFLPTVAATLFNDENINFRLEFQHEENSLGGKDDRPGDEGGGK